MYICDECHQDFENPCESYLTAGETCPNCGSHHYTPARACEICGDTYPAEFGLQHICDECFNHYADLATCAKYAESTPHRLRPSVKLSPLVTYFFDADEINRVMIARIQADIERGDANARFLQGVLVDFCDESAISGQYDSFDAWLAKNIDAAMLVREVE